MKDTRSINRNFFSAFSVISGIYALLLAIYLILRFVVGDRFWWLAFLNNFAPYYFLPLVIFVPLALIERRWSSLARLLPFVLIALLLYGPYWLPKNVAAAAEDQPLKVLTFNVLPANPRLDDVIDWIREMDADIVLLQELAPHVKTRLRDELADLYPYSDDLPDNQLTLSRYELLTNETVELVGWWAQRSTFAINGRTIAIYNIHLIVPTNEVPHFYTPIDNGFVHLVLQYDETRRNAQIHALLERLKTESLPYIVAGDFNTSDNAIIYGEMSAALHDSFRESGIGMGASWTDETGEEGLPNFLPPLIRIDYVWHSDEIKAISANVGPRLGSDHLPLIVSLQQKQG